MNKKSTGMILSLENENAIVLTHEGEFLKTSVKKGTYFVGDEISFVIEEGHFLTPLLKKLNFSTMGISIKKPVVQAVFSLSLIVLTGVGSWAYPTGRVYMDVNPSLGLSYNIYHRVIGVESFNEEGAQITDKLSLYGSSLTEGLEETFKVMDEQGYIKDKEEGVSGVLLGFTDPSLETEMVSSLVKTSEALHKTVQVGAVTINPVSEEIAKEQKGQKEVVTPIEAEMAGQKIKDKVDGNNGVKKDKAQIKAEIKALVKKIKEEKKPSSENAPVSPEKAPIKKIKENLKDNAPVIKDKAPILKDKAPVLKDKTPVVKDSGVSAIEKIDKEIAQLTKLLEALQESGGKEKLKAVKIKKILKRIEKLNEEKAELEKK